MTRRETLRGMFLLPAALVPKGLVPPEEVEVFLPSQLLTATRLNKAFKAAGVKLVPPK